jgi:hypothetical protein
MKAIDVQLISFTSAFSLMVVSPLHRFASAHTHGKISRILACFLGLLLLTAAGLKAHDLMLRPNPASLLLGSPWFHATFVEAELILGLWAISGVAHKLACTILALAFSSFALIAFAEAIHGATSCGCFGGLTTNPWHTAIFDSLAAVALIFFRPPPTYQAGPLIGLRIATLLVIAILAAGPLVAAASRSACPEITTTTDPGNHQAVFLDPPAWLGKPFPLDPFVHIPDNLSKGKWLILLVHADCPRCRAVSSTVDALVTTWKHQGLSPSILIIELPPYPDNDIAPSGPCKRARVTCNSTLFAHTPALIKLVDGQVVEAPTHRKDFTYAITPF